MTRDFTGEEYYGPEDGLVCWECIPNLPRGKADNLAYAHVIWKFFFENFPGARMSQEGKISVDDVDKILQGKLFHKQLLHLNKFSFEQNLESDSEEHSTVPIFNEAALKIGTKKFSQIKNSKIFKEMVQDGEIDYYEARRLVYSLSLTLNEANIKTDIKGTVYPRTGLTGSQTNNELYHEWTNFVFRELNFYQDYWRIAASSGSGIDKKSIEQKWYPKIKREMAKVGLRMELSAEEYVNEVFRRYNIDQSDEDSNQHGYLAENATLNHHEAREWIYVFAEYITDDDEFDEIVAEKVAESPIVEDETGEIETDATDVDASEIQSEIAISTLKRKEVTFKKEAPETTLEPLESYFDNDMKIIRRIIQRMNDDVVQKWKNELFEVQNLRCNNKLFAVRGESYSLFGYTVMNKLMIMKSYWIGKMFSSLKILDAQFEALETYLVFIGSVIDKLDDEEFRNNLRTNHRLAKEDMARQTKGADDICRPQKQTISSDHCLSWWNDEKAEKPNRSHFYEEEDVLLNGDISYELEKIILNDTEKVNQLMAKIVIFMDKLCLKKMNLPENGRITDYQFKTEFGNRLAENLLTLRDVCFKDVNARIETMEKYSRNKRKKLLKFQTIFKSVLENAEEEKPLDFETSCLHNSPDAEIGVKFSPAIQEIENILNSSSFLISPVAMGKKRYNY